MEIREATVAVLADRPDLTMTYARLRPEGGPPLHHMQADSFVILGGKLFMGLGDGAGAAGRRSTADIERADRERSS